MRRKHITPLTAALVILVVLCCGEKERENPFDPGNPDYQEPSVTITSGPQSGDTLSESEARFTWEGNNRACQYSYKLAYEFVFDTAPWSDWTHGTSVFFQDLDEQVYAFAVKARYPTGKEQESPAARQFTVNAYQGPSLLIKPCLTTADLNQQFSVEVTAEEMENLMAAKINLNFSKDTLEIVQNGIEKGAFLGGNEVEVVLFDSVLNSQGRVEIDLGIAEASPPGVSGSGALVVITFKTKERGAASIFFESYELRDTDNQTIQINDSRGGKVTIQ